MSKILRGAVSGPALSAVWLLLCGVYIHTQVGWGILLSLLPHEMAITVLGVLAPLAFIWVVTGFYARARALTESARTLAERVDALVYPSAAAEERARTVSANLEAQSTAITTAAASAPSTGWRAPRRRWRTASRTSSSPLPPRPSARSARNPA